MIPSTVGFLDQDFEIEEQPSKSYKINLGEDTIYGYCNKKDAIEQAIYKILNTERYQYLIYSWNYGVELKNLYGEPITYVYPELERRITEALVWDSRIDSVTDFKFNITKKGCVHVTFTVHSIFGDIMAEKKVDV